MADWCLRKAGRFTGKHTIDELFNLISQKHKDLTKDEFVKVSSTLVRDGSIFITHDGKVSSALFPDQILRQIDLNRHHSPQD